jgi:hypothetical protein
MKSNKPNLDREDAWMTIIESIVLFLATWLNPEAGVLLFLLKLCFQTLKTLRHHHRPHNKDDKK